MSADMLSDGRLFVLEYRGDIIVTGGWRWQVDVGTATTVIETDRADQPGIFRGAYAEIAAIYVDPFLARIGLASWLIATLEADIARLGLREVRIAAATLPAWCALGLFGLAIAPTLLVIVSIMAVERAIAFASAAVKVLYTVVDPEENYKAQNFIDTVVYRGGDAASGWVFNTLGKTVGLAGGVVALTAVPAAIAWLYLSFSLSRELNERTAARDASGGQNP
jgi:GNAT superfamily N-acetyltransferase